MNAMDVMLCHHDKIFYISHISHIFHIFYIFYVLFIFHIFYIFFIFFIFFYIFKINLPMIEHWEQFTYGQCQLKCLKTNKCWHRNWIFCYGKIGLIVFNFSICQSRIIYDIHIQKEEYKNMTSTSMFICWKQNQNKTLGYMKV